VIYLPRRGRLAAQVLMVAGRHTGDRPNIRSGAGACSRATYAAHVLRVIPRNTAQSAAVHQSVGSSSAVGVGVIALNGTRGRNAALASSAGRRPSRIRPPFPGPMVPGRAVVDENQEDDLQRQQAHTDGEDDQRNRSGHVRHGELLPLGHDTLSGLVSKG
jgi:hypothetical protein